MVSKTLWHPILNCCDKPVDMQVFYIKVSLLTQMWQNVLIPAQMTKVNVYLWINFLAKLVNMLRTNNKNIFKINTNLWNGFHGFKKTGVKK